jgi:hypothetical protein
MFCTTASNMIHVYDGYPSSYNLACATFVPSPQIPMATGGELFLPIILLSLPPPRLAQGGPVVRHVPTRPIPPLLS